MRKHALSGLVAAGMAMALLTAPGQAQVVTVSLEARAGAAIPLTDFAEQREEARPGISWGALASAQLIPALAAYGGFSQHNFACNRCDSMTGSGFEAGLRVSLPGPVMLDPWLRGGAVFHQLEITGSGILGDVTGQSTMTSDRATGFELGGGLTVDLIPGLQITPGVRWVVYPAEFGGATRRDVNHLAADVGFRAAF